VTTAHFLSTPRAGCARRSKALTTHERSRQYVEKIIELLRRRNRLAGHPGRRPSRWIGSLVGDQARAKLDAIPDLSDPQVIVFTEWMGRSPTLVEDRSRTRSCRS
jgi:hypothetical protein